MWGDIPATLREQRSPVDKEDEKLEYDVYGRFKFEEERAGVDALGRAWVPIEVLAATENWDDETERFEERVAALRAAFE